MRNIEKRATIRNIFKKAGDPMSEKKKEFSDYFDDDFEVTYDGDDDFSDSRGYEDVDYDDTDYNDTDPDYDDSDFDDSDYDDTGHDNNRRSSRENSPDRQRTTRRRKSRRGVPLAAPIRRGGRTLSRLASALVRSLTAVLILAVTVYVTWTFYRASTPYGDIMEAAQTLRPSVTLAAYLAIAVLFLLFELISLLWSMTRVRVRNGADSWKEDTGRGLFSFIAVFAASYLAFLFSPFLPDAPEAVYGIKGALEVYGSMHNVLFGLCAAGVISCIVRKFF